MTERGLPAGVLHSSCFLLQYQLRAFEAMLLDQCLKKDKFIFRTFNRFCKDCKWIQEALVTFQILDFLKLKPDFINLTQIIQNESQYFFLKRGKNFQNVKILPTNLSLV